MHYLVACDNKDTHREISSKIIHTHSKSSPLRWNQFSYERVKYIDIFKILADRRSSQMPTFFKNYYNTSATLSKPYTYDIIFISRKPTVV